MSGDLSSAPAILAKGPGPTVAIVNPMAQSGAAGDNWAQIRDALRVRLGGLRTRYTEGPGHAALLCREALEAGAQTILSVGGDGTCNEVLGGFVDPEDGHNRFPEATLAVLAAGTGGDFQRMFGRARLVRQVDRLCAAETRSVDYGVARFVDDDGRPRLRPFLNVASVGVSGEVVRQVNASNAQLGATAKYLLGTFQGIARWRNVQVEIQRDDEPARRVDLTLGIVANGQYFGAGMWVAPRAEIDDGQFDCVEVTGMSKRTLIATLAKVFEGRHLRVRGVEHSHGQKVSMRPVWAEAEVPVELDGETVGRLPASFELRAGSLRLRVG
ncbi:YegS/Rv2252/BmrU family lipid kinase [Pseudenhygromyxa sp. WMMC2535]|uniref:YegS/Rv2252/BmrU family lipid kinase n=1 Tax=Pseudenhygromyxa sp. WMMC2535 TaxID=2712867 RepID=UPI0015536D97|nr:YegS/Rv2252/BmrU family lipid kinase [Pseudenhygromyxa sp. WMMC2535]